MENRDLITKLGGHWETDNALSIELIRIDGSELDTTAGTAGIDCGKNLVTAKDDGANVVTLTFKNALDLAPTVLAMARNANTHVKVTTQSTTQIIYSTVDMDSNGTGVNDADVDLVLIIPRGLEVV